MKRVTGIGGIFFKAKDPAKLKEWYNKHLGVPVESWGTMFMWNDPKGCTVWSPFPSDTKYLEPSTQSFMINYRVENLVELLKLLKEEGVEQVGKLTEEGYGKFAWIMDPEGNKIELWEPPKE